MKVLVLAAISFAATISLAQAQMGVPGAGGSGVPVSPPPISPTVKLFTVNPGDNKTEWSCDPGRGEIQSLSAVQGDENQNVTVVFLDDQNNPVAEDKPVSVNRFRFERTPSKPVRVTMICGR